MEMAMKERISRAMKLASYLHSYTAALGMREGLAALTATYLLRRHGQLAEIPRKSGTVWLRDNPADRFTFRLVFIERDYDTSWWRQNHARLQRRYDHALSKGRVPIIVDAGANIGMASIWFAEQFPKAIVHAVEPDEGNFSMLARNAVGRPIVPLAGAVWDRPTRLHIANPDGASDAFRVVEGDGDLRAYSIPEIVSLEPRGELFIVKVDIEGGEASLFRSNTEWARDAALIIIEPHDWLYPGEGVTSTFRKVIANLPADLMMRGENLFCFAAVDNDEHIGPT
jgi:FkbM family methyltransferase